MTHSLWKYSQLLLMVMCLLFCLVSTFEQKGVAFNKSKLLACPHVELKNKLELEKIALRYKHGVEVIQLIYEKILALDHHFTALNTLQQINNLSNPNAYPQFVKIKEKLKENVKRKSSIDLPNLMDNNSLVSLSYSVISSIFGTGNKKERTAELNEIACLLDFTVNMHSDLNIIHYETDFLKIGNMELRSECERLFVEYSKKIGYNRSLSYCRDNDDWDQLFIAFDEKFKFLHEKIAISKTANQKNIVIEFNNLEFKIDRLVAFVESYMSFIKQGERYYQKFAIIIGNYRNKDHCLDQLPVQYVELESEINNSIEKFKTAYNVAELDGTKLRNLLYGIPH